MMTYRFYGFALAFFTISSAVFAQNYTLIKATDTPKEIIYKAAHVTPTESQWRWQALELTGFFHFGINTFTNKEWGDGTEDPKLFNPTAFDANQWVAAAKAGGIKQVIITAKHHDGFCLWPSKYTAYSVKNSPWKEGKGDVVKELAEACKKQGVTLGIYLSPWDRNAASYGTAAYNDYFTNQLTELLTQYGQIDEVWFDGANGEGPNGKKQEYDFQRWYQLIRKLQPQAVIAVMGPDVRWVGTESGYGRETEWSVIPSNNLDVDDIAASSQKNNMTKPVGDMMESDLGGRDKIMDTKALVWYPAETDVSIRPGWFFHADQNNQVKTPEKLLDIYFNSVGKNGVLLLNIPPDTRGLVHEADVKNLTEWKAKIDQIFDVNLLAKAKITVEGSSSKGKLSALVDNKINTFWTTGSEQDSTTTISFNLKKPITFDVFSAQEFIKNGQRVEDFTLEYKQNGQWVDALSGSTIGYKRLIKLKEPVTAQEIRFKISSSRLNPMISEIGLYKE